MSIAKFFGMFLAVISLASPAMAQYTPTVRVVTKKTVAANTSTNVCPATAAIKTEVQVQTGNVGLGLSNQTLTGAAYGTTSSDPDLVLPSANSYFLDAWGINQGVSAYTATSQVVICIQTIRG